MPFLQRSTSCSLLHLLSASCLLASSAVCSCITQVLAHTASGRVARSRCLVRLMDVQPAAVEELCQPDDEGGTGGMTTA